MNDGRYGNANGLGQDERELLARITAQIDRCSAYQHRLDRRRTVLREAATQLRLGQRSSVVRASIEAQLPDDITMIQLSLEE